MKLLLRSGISARPAKSSKRRFNSKSKRSVSRASNLDPIEEFRQDDQTLSSAFERMLSGEVQVMALSSRKERREKKEKRSSTSAREGASSETIYTLPPPEEMGLDILRGSPGARDRSEELGLDILRGMESLVKGKVDRKSPPPSAPPSSASKQYLVKGKVDRKSPPPSALPSSASEQYLVKRKVDRKSPPPNAPPSSASEQCLVKGKVSSAVFEPEPERNSQHASPLPSNQVTQSPLPLPLPSNQVTQSHLPLPLPLPQPEEIASDILSGHDETEAPFVPPIESTAASVQSSPVMDISIEQDDVRIKVEGVDIKPEDIHVTKSDSMYNQPAGDHLTDRKRLQRHLRRTRSNGQSSEISLSSSRSQLKATNLKPLRHLGRTRSNGQSSEMGLSSSRSQLKATNLKPLRHLGRTRSNGQSSEISLSSSRSQLQAATLQPHAVQNASAATVLPMDTTSSSNSNDLAIESSLLDVNFTEMLELAEFFTDPFAMNTWVTKALFPVDGDTEHGIVATDNGASANAPATSCDLATTLVQQVERRVEANGHSHSQSHAGEGKGKSKELDEQCLTDSQTRTDKAKKKSRSKRVHQMKILAKLESDEMMQEEPQKKRDEADERKYSDMRIQSPSNEPDEMSLDKPQRKREKVYESRVSQSEEKTPPDECLDDSKRDEVPLVNPPSRQHNSKRVCESIQSRPSPASFDLSLVVSSFESNTDQLAEKVFSVESLDYGEPHDVRLTNRGGINNKANEYLRERRDKQQSTEKPEEERFHKYGRSNKSHRDRRNPHSSEVSYYETVSEDESNGPGNQLILNDVPSANPGSVYNKAIEYWRRRDRQHSIEESEEERFHTGPRMGNNWHGRSNNSHRDRRTEQSSEVSYYVTNNKYGRSKKSHRGRRHEHSSEVSYDETVSEDESKEPDNQLLLKSHELLLKSHDLLLTNPLRRKSSSKSMPSHSKAKSKNGRKKRRPRQRLSEEEFSIESEEIERLELKNDNQRRRRSRSRTRENDGRGIRVHHHPSYSREVRPFIPEQYYDRPAYNDYYPEDERYDEFEDQIQRFGTMQLGRESRQIDAGSQCEC